MASHRKQQERKKQRRRRLKQERLREGSLLDSMVVIEPVGKERMSEVLMEFVEPYSGQWETLEELDKLLSFASIAWNAALLPSSKQATFIDEAVAKMPPDLRPEMRTRLEEMVQRKLTHFAGIKRAIINFQVSMTPEGPHVLVASTLEGEK